MSTPTERLEELVQEYLTQDQGEAAPRAVVAALATTGNGHLRTSAGVGLPISKATEYKQLAAYLVDRYLQGTRPNPANSYLGQMAQFIGARLAGNTPAAVSGSAIRTLAALALGHVSSFMPPVARAAAAAKIAELYLAGL
jgi:hypothetical protein